jgi:hypothetical protein
MADPDHQHATCPVRATERLDARHAVNLQPGAGFPRRALPSPSIIAEADYEIASVRFGSQSPTQNSMMGETYLGMLAVRHESFAARNPVSRTSAGIPPLPNGR